MPTSHLKHCGWKSLSSAWIREAWKIQCHRVVTISGKLPTGTIERLFKNERGNKNHFDSLPNSHGFPEWQFLNKYSCPPPWSDPPSAQSPSCKRYSERQISLCNPDNDHHDDDEEEEGDYGDKMQSSGGRVDINQPEDNRACFDHLLRTIYRTGCTWYKSCKKWKWMKKRLWSKQCNDAHLQTSHLKQAAW